MAPATREPALKWRAGAGRGADPRFLAKNTAVYAPGGGTRARGRPGGSARPGETRAAGAPRPRARRKPRRFWPETRIRPPGGRASPGAGGVASGGGAWARDAGRLGAGGAANGGRQRDGPAPHQANPHRDAPREGPGTEYEGGAPGTRGAASGGRPRGTGARPHPAGARPRGRRQPVARLSAGRLMQATPPCHPPPHRPPGGRGGVGRGTSLTRNTESAISGQKRRGLRAREAAFARGRPGGSARPGETRAAGAPRPRARRKPRRFWPETRIRPPGGVANGGRPGRKNAGRPGANCPQGSGKGVHPRPPEAKRTRPGRSRNPSDRAAPGESGCPPSRRCGECATWPC